MAAQAQFTKGANCGRFAPAGFFESSKVPEIADATWERRAGSLRAMFDRGAMDEATWDVIGAAMAVHRQLGPGLLESVYGVFLAHELGTRGHEVVREAPVPARYRGVEVKCAFRADLLVDDKVLIELKAVAKIDPVHTAQLLTYLRLANRPIGLLINFNSPILKDGIRRIINPRSPL